MNKFWPTIWSLILGIMLLLGNTGSVLAAANGPCVSNNEFASYSGSELRPSGFTTVRGIATGHTYSTTRLFPCIKNSDTEGLAAYWIAVAPASGGTPNSLLQIGLFKTPDNTASHVFWAKGGCGAGNGVPPNARDLGVAPAGTVDFTITRRSGGGFDLYWYFSAGGGGGPLFVSQTDSAISCWIAGNLKGQVYCERQDQGTGCGSSSFPVSVYGIQYQVSQSGTWHHPGDGSYLPNLTCSHNGADDHCSNPDGDDLLTYTSQ